LQDGEVETAITRHQYFFFGFLSFFFFIKTSSLVKNSDGDIYNKAFFFWGASIWQSGEHAYTGPVHFGSKWEKTPVLTLILTTKWEIII